MKQRPRRRRPASGPVTSYEAVVEKLGSEGMGLVRLGTRPVLVPDSLPGERVAIRVSAQARIAELEARLSSSPERVPAPCPHYGVCGGCQLQHPAQPFYLDFKRELVRRALLHQGIHHVEVAPVLACAPATRRRATFAARRLAGRQLLGFHGKASDAVIDIGVCPVLAPELVALLAPLRILLGEILMPGEKAQLHLALTDNGVDAGLLLDRAPGPDALNGMGTFAHAQDLARCWWRTDEIAPVQAAELRRPEIRFGQVPVGLPMNGFLQATKAGETTLQRLVALALGTAAQPGQLADLYAGCGTFAVPLAQAGWMVRAVETDAAAVASLTQAARVAGLARLTAERRDLRSNPLSPEELNGYDAVVFDPPRAGAVEQVRALARSTVPVIVGVSCNPATFARDAATLIEAGWRLDEVQTVDQFLWSPHVELVACFRR